MPTSNATDHLASERNVHAPFGEIDRVPLNVSYLARTANERFGTCRIGFRWQAKCQHATIENFQPPEYYEDYLMTTSASASIQELQSTQLERIIAARDGGTTPASLVEVGCGDGSFLRHASRRIARVLGIEPSRPFAEEAVRAGFDVIAGYVGSSKALTSEKFDAFVSRQVFEHLPDPLDVLVGIRKMMNPGAVGLIEVPNGFRALRMKRFFEFFPDHVNYFSVNSLVELASLAGFNVIECREVFGGDYLEMLLRFDVEPERFFGEMVEHRQRVVSTLEVALREVKQVGNRVAIFGCGAKTLCVLAACSEEFRNGIECVIDSDPHKHGKFVPDSCIPVISVGSAREIGPEVVLILALSYREEIAKLVKRELPSCRRLLSLADDGKVVEVSD